ncbi:MAG: 30S ribosome-binding factor RbfA [Candidatus Pacebacteria bacterium]|nr:30S ribosome-binding factor RbfA [Candidatus Paceibacterota bacterium]
METNTNRRINKLNNLFQREIGAIIFRIIPQFEKKELLNITKVEISKDLEYANVFLSVYPEKYEKEAIKEIKKNLPEIRSILAKRLKLFKIPKINFKIDEGEKNLENIIQIERSLKNKNY